MAPPCWRGCWSVDDATVGCRCVMGAPATCIATRAIGWPPPMAETLSHISPRTRLPLASAARGPLPRLLRAGGPAPRPPPPPHAVVGGAGASRAERGGPRSTGAPALGGGGL